MAVHSRDRSTQRALTRQFVGDADPDGEAPDQDLALTGLGNCPVLQPKLATELVEHHGAHPGRKAFPPGGPGDGG